jgi:cytochrome c553
VDRVKKWLIRGTAGVLILLVLAIAGLYLLTERTLRRAYPDVPLQAFTAPTDSASVAAGERLARLRGCLGCHGGALEGGVFFDEPLVGRIVVPDLTRVAREYTDSELERAIRGGVRKNGRGMLVMPSDMFYSLTDDDLGSIIAFVRSLDPGEGPETEISLGPLARGMLRAVHAFLRQKFGTSSGT